MIQAVFDESGTDAEAPYVTVAGYISTVQRWERFSAEWRETLRAFGLTRFHMVDFAQRVREFASWDEKRRVRVFNRFARLIDKHVRFGIGFAVVKADFERIVLPYISEQHPLHEPYIWIIKCLVETLARAQSRGRIPRRPVALILDKGCHSAALAHRYIESLQVTAPKWGNVVASVTSSVNEEFPPLQAADIIAYEVRKYVADYEARGKKIPRRTLLRLGAHKPVDFAYHAEESLTRMISSMKAEGMLPAEQP